MIITEPKNLHNWMPMGQVAKILKNAGWRALFCLTISSILFQGSAEEPQPAGEVIPDEEIVAVGYSSWLRDGGSSIVNLIYDFRRGMECAIYLDGRIEGDRSIYVLSPPPDRHQRELKEEELELLLKRLLAYRAREYWPERLEILQKEWGMYEEKTRYLSPLESEYNAINQIIKRIRTILNERSGESKRRE